MFYIADCVFSAETYIIQMIKAPGAHYWETP